MAAAFNVQTADGDVADANAYVALADFKQYHDDRGNDYSGSTDPEIKTAIVRATDFVDTRYSYIGVRRNGEDQTTEWPKADEEDGDILTNNFGDELDITTDLPTAVVKATCEYAFRALTAVLYQDSPAPSGGREVIEDSKKLDVLEIKKRYAPGSLGVEIMPAFPQADRMLRRAGLVDDGDSEVIR